MAIITPHEDDHLTRVRRPFGTEYQGRYPEAAHPATDVGADDDDLPPRPPMLRHDPLFLLLAAAFSVGVVYLAAMGAWPYLSAMASAIKRGWFQ